MEEIKRVAEMVRRLRAQSQHVAQTVAFALGGTAEEGFDELLRSVDPLSVGELTAEPTAGLISNSISPEIILLIHRMVGFELPSRTIGRFRDATVEIRKLGDETPYVKPPDHTLVPTLLIKLCKNWLEEITSAQSEKEKLKAIAKFHADFLRIHPFSDGNGRVARAIMLQQCVDVFQVVDMSKLDRGAEYARALSAADVGNIEALSEIVRRVVAN
ncbi:hypothetical protein DS906_11610 [Ruegeria sp. A3M17]|nr:hypothetical protein DS906_11610 [Ruegeria sp. A3M17]